jgi:hypothetical protein
LLSLKSDDSDQLQALRKVIDDLVANPAQPSRGCELPGKLNDALDKNGEPWELKENIVLETMELDEIQCDDMQGSVSETTP